MRQYYKIVVQNTIKKYNTIIKINLINYKAHFLIV